MDLLTLHHFEASPFSEKIRRVLGAKGLAWQSVLIPRIAPKPELTALTGGYRKTPVAQLGRDIYCDTKLIARVIERLAPSPALLPAAQAASIGALEALADTRLFMAAIPVLFSPEGRAALAANLGEDYLARFQADRAALFAGGTVDPPDTQFSRAVWAPTLAALDAQLAHSRFLLGDVPTLADCAVFAPVWYVRANAGVAASLDRYRHLMDWFERVRALGHGTRDDISAADAHAIAARSRAWQPLPESGDCDIAPGTRVTVAATDYGVDGVTGELVHAGAKSWTLARSQPRIGPLRVHFPRAGFRVVANTGCSADRDTPF